MKSRNLISSTALILSVCFSAQAFSQSQSLESLEARAGYSIGVNIGMNLANQGVAEDLDVDALILGLGDAVSGELKMSREEIVGAIQEFTDLQQSKAEAAIALQAEQNASFLVENAAKDGVTSTASGLQYEVLESVSGDSAMPLISDVVRVHYHGTLIDGTVFDSSVERGEPISFSLSGVIPGWTEGLQLMKVGEKFRFLIPSELAYGANGAPPTIGPNVPLVFEVELLGIE